MNKNLIKYNGIWMVCKMYNYSSDRFREELNNNFTKKELIDVLVTFQEMSDDKQKSKTKEVNWTKFN